MKRVKQEKKEPEKVETKKAETKAVGQSGEPAKRTNSYTTHEIRAEVRQSGDTSKKYVIRGYPILFNHQTTIEGYWRSYREMVSPNALDETDLSNVYLLGDHDPANLLGRAGINLRLEKDETGLFMECELVEGDTYAQNIYKRVARGILDGMSFGFTIEKESVTQEEGELDLRVIERIGKLYEITLTPFPAYQAASVVAKREDNNGDEPREDSDDKGSREEPDDDDDTKKTDDADPTDFKKLMEELKEA